MTLDIEPLVEMRRGVDDGASVVAVLMFTEGFVVIATVAAVPSNGFALPLVAAAGAGYWAQIRLLRGAPLGFCDPQRLWNFGGLAVGVGLAGSLATGDWYVLGSVVFMTTLVSRPALRAVRAVRSLCALRSQLEDPAALDRLVWRRNGGERTRLGAARIVGRARGELAAGAIVTGIVVVLLATETFPIAGAGALWLILLPAIFFGMRARRRSQLSAGEQRRRDLRPPTVILRTFQDDGLQVAGKAFTIPGLSQFRLRPCSLEEVVAHAARTVGPPLIIGEPGERLPRLGAAREYAAAETWHDAVTQLIDASHRSFFVLGESENLAWELTTAIEHTGLERIVLVMPPTKAPDIAARWQGLAGRVSALAAELPKLPESTSLVAVFHLDDGPAYVTAGRRWIWSYLIALWLVVVCDESGVPSAPDLSGFLAANLPPVGVVAADG